MKVQLQELNLGDNFKFQDQIYVKLKEVNTNEEYEHKIFNCKDELGRHRPFRDDTEVDQMKLKRDGFN